LDIDEINQKLKEYTRSGFRILCLAVSDRYRVEEFSHLTLIGFILLKDEVRKEAIDGIRLVENAGVQTVMITGDNKDTALSIGREVGLIKKDTDLVLTSNELNGLSDEEVKKPLRFLRQREIIHFQRFGEALSILQQHLDSDNYYAFNPSFDEAKRKETLTCFDNKRY